MTTSRRERLRESTREEIKSIARKHMQEQGTAAISLRAIARDMGLTVMALYRYFPSRDDLLTALILDTFNALADAMEQADYTQSRDAHANRIWAVMLAYRDWAIAHPVDFQLIYGNPVPEYHAPEEVTVAAARRGFDVVLKILGDALVAGQLVIPTTYHHLPPHVNQHMTQMIEAASYNVSLPIVYIGVVGWARMHGMIMLELFNHTPPVVGNPAEFYRFEIHHLLNSIGLDPQGS